MNSRNKKSLLLTTALVGASLLAAPVTRQARATNFTISTVQTAPQTLGNGDTLTVTNTGKLEASVNVAGAATSVTTELGGTISGAIAILIQSNARVTGTITNNGLIVGTTAISVQQNGAGVGSLTNSGLIQGGNFGVAVSGSGVTIGSIANDANSTIEGAVGIYVSTGASVPGGVTNSGLIFGGNGIEALSGANIAFVTNNASGTIKGSSAAGIFVSNAEIPGAITNSGVIVGGAYGLELTGDEGVPATIGSIVNNLGGTISGGATGILISGAVSITGGITNNGLITGTQKGIDIFAGQGGFGLPGGGGTASAGVATSVLFITNNGTIGGGIGLNGGSGGLGGAGLSSAHGSGAGGAGGAGGAASVTTVTNNGTINGGIAVTGGFGGASGEGGGAALTGTGAAAGGGGSGGAGGEASIGTITNNSTDTINNGITLTGGTGSGGASPGSGGGGRVINGGGIGGSGGNGAAGGEAYVGTITNDGTIDGGIDLAGGAGGAGGPGALGGGNFNSSIGFGGIAGAGGEASIGTIANDQMIGGGIQLSGGRGGNGGAGGAGNIGGAPGNVGGYGGAGITGGAAGTASVTSITNSGTISGGVALSGGAGGNGGPGGNGGTGGAEAPPEGGPGGNGGGGGNGSAGGAASISAITNGGTINGGITLIGGAGGNGGNGGNGGAQGGIPFSGEDGAGGAGANGGNGGNGGAVSLGTMTNSGTLSGGIEVMGGASAGTNGTGGAQGTGGAEAGGGGGGGTGGADGAASIGSVTNNGPGIISANTAILVKTGGSIGTITNDGTIEGTGGTAISLNGLTSQTRLVIDGGQIIGNVTDNAPQNGFSPVTIGGNFTTQGNFTVSSVTVNAGEALTISAGDTVSMNTMPTPSATSAYRFTLDSLSSFGKVAVTGAGNAATLAPGNIAVNVTGALAVGDVFQIATDNAVDAGIPAGQTPVRGTALWDIAVSNNGDDVDLTVTGQNQAATSGSNQGVFQVLPGLSGTTDPDLGKIVNNVNNAPNSAALGNILSSLQPATDLGVFDTAYEMLETILDMTEGRLNAAGASSPGAGGGGGRAGSADGPRTGMAAGDTGGGRSFWGQFFGQTAHQVAGGGLTGFSANTAGFAMGADTDRLLRQGVVGAAISYGNGFVSSKDAEENQTTLESYQVSLYGDYDLGSHNFLRGMLAYALDSDGNTRHNVGGVTGLTAKGSYDANEYSAELKAGHHFAAGSSVVTPSLMARYIGYDGGSYTESGAGGGDLHVNQKYLGLLEVGPNVEARWNYANPDGSRFVPALHAGYRYDLIDDPLAATSSFTGGGAAFETLGAKPNRNRFDLGLDTSFYTTQAWEFKASYDLDLRQDYVSNNAVLRATYRF